MNSYRALTALVMAFSGCVTAQQAAAADQEFICDLTRWNYDQNGDRVGDGSKVAAGQVEEWQGVCKRAESPDARGQ
jgi:hypothetical protein